MNIKIVQEYRIFTRFGELIIFLSILTFFIALVFSSEVGRKSNNVLTDMFVPSMTDGLFWLKILFCVMSLEAIDIMINVKKRLNEAK